MVTVGSSRIAWGLAMTGDLPDCPICGSDNVVQRGDGLLKCLNCDALFKSNGGITVVGPDPDTYEDEDNES